MSCRRSSPARLYQEFLDNVCDTTEYFEGIENITMRYETLEAANHDLKARVENAQREAEDQVCLAPP